MHKKIPVNQLRVGMHLLRLEGSWISHPFWRARFVVEDPQVLAKVRASGVTECWIDTALGLDVAPPEAAAPALPVAPLAVTPAPAPAAAATPAPPPGRTAFDEELRQAAALCNKSRRAVAAMFNEARMGRTLDAEACLPLVEDIAGSVMRNPGALVSLARLKTRDDYSYMHSVAVCALMVSLGRHIGLDEDQCREAGQAGLLHDIGKALMPLEVLNKPGKLTDAEFAVMREHPQRGHQLLAEGRAASSVTLDVALHHHERIDGTGYPHRLDGDAIDRYARMGAVCDVYDAITSNRPYKAGWDPATAVARMASWKGHFDTTLFAAFVQSLGIYPTGSLVRLESKRVAVVAEQNEAALTSPVVVVFYSLRSGMPIAPLRLDLSSATAQDRIVGREEVPVGHYGRVDELWADPEMLRLMRG
ncbi:MAG: HD-GYP domain-containing protein [Rubrivivax sp.]|nr:HD-GYP domain-containing protein [Rubrivivax sp.]